MTYGAVRTWESCGIEGFPKIIAPLQVEEEISSSYKMEGVGKMAEIGWQGMYMFSIDHKNGYFHCKIHESSWTYFAFYWEGILYAFVVLCFGWSPAPFIYSTLTDSGGIHTKCHLSPFHYMDR